MLRAIIYKEWIKTRWALLVLSILGAAGAGYAMLRMARAIALNGAGHIWEVMLTRDAVFVEPIEFLPLITGIALAVVQFTPEMQRKCFKLTLHLPCAEWRTIGIMLLFGIAALTLCSAIEGAIIRGYARTVLAPELTSRILYTAVPWFLAGIAAYLLTAWITLEPAWRRRILYLPVAFFVLRLYFLAPGPDAYRGFLPYLTLYTLLLASLVWLSVQRFRAGKQD